MKTQAAIFSPAGCEAATTSHRARLASSAASVIMSCDDSEHLWFVRETQQILHWSCTGHFRIDSSKKMNWWKKLEIIKKKKKHSCWKHCERPEKTALYTSFHNTSSHLRFLLLMAVILLPSLRLIGFIIFLLICEAVSAPWHKHPLQNE